MIALLVLGALLMYNSSNIMDSFKSKMRAELKNIQQQNNKYIPTGLQEDIILAVGQGKYQIVVAIDANKVGKTTTIMNIARQIMDYDNNPHFNFWEGENIFKRWPHQTKKFRITGTPTNLKDNGPIQEELEKWWPAGKYTRKKDFKGYYSFFTYGEWSGDAMTYEQSASEYEGPMLSLVISDEPPKSKLVGAINSRMAEGGVWIIGMTPIECGAFLDSLDDLIDNGKRVKIVSGSVYNNDIESGKPNHNNTKCGLWTKQQIEDYVAGIPLDERDARVYGIPNNKSGKIYKEFNIEDHVIDFDMNMLSQCDCYMSIDPHRKFYPAIGWHAVTPNACVVTYNEWPKYDDLGAYYDEVRKIKHFDKNYTQLANIILANDYSVQYGTKILARYPDPYYDDVEEFISKMMELGVVGWKTPEREKIEIQRANLQDLLCFNAALPKCGLNMPEYFIHRECTNVIRCLNRHHWEEKNEKEAEQYKDFVDMIRQLLAGVGGRPLYIGPQDFNIKAYTGVKVKNPLAVTQASVIREKIRKRG